MRYNRIKIRSGNYILKQIVTILLLFFIWIILSGNTFNPDTLSYERMYVGNSGKHEIGFMIICQFGYMAEMTYQEFRIVIYSIILFLLLFFAKRMKADCLWIFLMYFIYPLFLDGIQIRSALAYAIALIGIMALYSKNEFSVIKFLIPIILAASMHYMAIFYVIFLFVKIKVNRKSLRNIMGGLAFALLIFLYVYPTIVIDIVSFSSDKVRDNFANHAGIGVVVPIFLHILGFYLYEKLYIKLINAGMQDEKFNIHYKINIFMLLLIPFYAFSMNFFRIYRLMIFANNVFISNKCNLKKGPKLLKVQLATIGYILLLGILQIYLGGLQEDFFSNNIFL